MAGPVLEQAANKVKPTRKRANEGRRFNIDYVRCYFIIEARFNLALPARPVEIIQVTMHSIGIVLGANVAITIRVQRWINEQAGTFANMLR
jgi:hypothetical protein